MDRTFSLAGRSAATAATANHAIAQLWNPSSSRPLWVVQIGLAKTVATADHHALLRSSARGTPGSSVSSAQQSDFGYDDAPPSGALLDLAAFTTQPTLVATAAYMLRWNLPAAVGSGFIWAPPAPIKVPPGTGLVLVTPQATAAQPADITFVWRE